MIEANRDSPTITDISVRGAGPVALIVRVSEASVVTSWVEVTHGGWEALGAEGHALREGYRVGWAQVLGAFLAGV